MFISQVIFESEKENEQILKEIMRKKKISLANAEGLLTVECWKTSKDTVGYALVSKWESKQYFQSWLVAEHKGKNVTNRKGSVIIKKTGYQFEDMTEIVSEA